MEKNPKIIASIAAIVFVILIGFLGYYYQNSVINFFMPNSQEYKTYIIKGVPYYNIYNSITLSSPSAAAYSILKYWNDSSVDPLELTNSLKAASTTPKQLGDYFVKKGYSVSVLAILSIDELGKYINSETSIPLITAQTIDFNFQAKGYTYRIIIGLDKENRQIVVNDFWFGNNYRISYDDFLKMWPQGKNYVIVVRPFQDSAVETVLNSLDKRPDYLSRPAQLDSLKNLFLSFSELYFSEGSSITSDSSREIDFIKKQIIGDSLFGSLPKIVRLRTYVVLSNMYFSQKKYDISLQYAQKAMDLNKDLDKPDGVWPVVNFVKNGESHYPYYSLAQIYRLRGKKDLAIQNYQKVLEISPYDAFAKRWLNSLMKTK